MPLTFSLLSALPLSACTSDSAVSCTDDTDCFIGEACNAGICAPVEDEPTPDTGDDSDLDAGDTNATDPDAADADIDAIAPDVDASDANDVEGDADPIEPPELPDDPLGRDHCTNHNLCGGCVPLNLNENPGTYNPDTEETMVCTDFNEVDWLATTPNALELRLSWDHPALADNAMGARAALVLCRDDATGFGDAERCVFTRMGAPLNDSAFEPVHVDIDRSGHLAHQLNLRFPPSERLHVGVAFVESRDNLRALRAEIAADVYVDESSSNQPPVFYPRVYEHGWLGRPGDIWYAGVIDWSQALPNAKYTPRGASYDLDRRCRTIAHERCGSSDRFFNANSVNVWNDDP